MEAGRKGLVRMAGTTANPQMQEGHPGPEQLALEGLKDRKSTCCPLNGWSEIEYHRIHGDLEKTDSF